MHASDSRTCMDASSTPEVRRKILVFEQDDFLNSLLHLLLHREGFEVSVVANSENAMAHITHTLPPDLLFINHTWLLEDQPEILCFKQLSHAWNDVSVVVMMNYYNEERTEKLSELGVNDVLLQPFEPNDLLDVVQKYTANR